MFWPDTLSPVSHLEGGSRVRRLAAGGNRIRTIGPAKAPGVFVLSFSFTPTFRLARMRPTNPISKAWVARGPMVQIRLPRAPLRCEPGRKPGVGSLAFRDYVWRGSASYATQKAADSSPGRSAPGRQWKLLNINVSESILSPSLPISLHARRSPSAAGQLDRESKWQSFRFVTAYAATQY